MIYLLTAIGLPPGDSSTVHRTTQNKQAIHRTTQKTIHRTTQKCLEQCGPCPVLTLVRRTDRKWDAQQCTVLLERSVIIWNTQSWAECSTLTTDLTPRSRVLPEKLTGTQLLKFPAFYATRRFSTAFTRARHMSHSWARSIQSIPSQYTWPARLIFHESITRTIFGEQYRSLSSSLCSFLHSPVTSSVLVPVFSLAPYSQTQPSIP
jgi:hypothetical protein